MGMTMKQITLATLVAACAATAANAQDESPDKPVWSGEGSLSAGVTTGNTDTADVGVGLKLAREDGPWKLATEGGYDYAEIDGAASRDRWYVSGQADRAFGDKAYAFSRISYEEDDFSGFDRRLFVGLGAGYHIWKAETLAWSVEASPGYRLDETADVIDPITGDILEPGQSISDIGVRGASRFSYGFNEAVSFTNNTDIVWAPESTQIKNTAALDAKLTKALTARISFEVRHDTNPPDGFRNTDTATRASIVYGF